jgi:glycosyltransferase involved in cell wall biosynthesis
MRRRVLHVATVLGSGGLEKWLVDLYAAMDPSQFDTCLLAQSDLISIHGERARQLGIPVFTLARGRNLLSFAAGFWNVLKTKGPFDVVHSHVHYFSGVVLALAWLAGVPVRIAHGHNDTSQWSRSLARRLYAAVARFLISVFATHGFGVTAACVRDLFGASCARDRRWQVLPCGIPLSAFHATWDRVGVAAELGIDPRAFVIVHVGRFSAMKNHEFSLRLLARLALPDAVLLLLGEGELEERLHQFARELGVHDRVVFAGVRADIPRLLSGLADALILPSLPGEGASIAATEAQASGVRALLSESTPESSIIVPGLVQRLGIGTGVEPWATALTDNRGVRSPVPAAECLRLVEASGFTIDANCRVLSEVYTSCGEHPDRTHRRSMWHRRSVRL